MKSTCRKKNDSLNLSGFLAFLGHNLPMEGEGKGDNFMCIYAYACG